MPRAVREGFTRGGSRRPRVLKGASGFARRVGERWPEHVPRRWMRLAGQGALGRCRVCSRPSVCKVEAEWCQRRGTFPPRTGRATCSPGPPVPQPGGGTASAVSDDGEQPSHRSRSSLVTGPPGDLLMRRRCCHSVIRTAGTEVPVVSSWRRGHRGRGRNCVGTGRRRWDGVWIRRNPRPPGALSVGRPADLPSRDRQGGGCGRGRGR